MVDGPAGNKGKLAFRQFTGRGSRGSRVADYGERVDGGEGVGIDWRKAKHNNVQGDRIGRQQSYASPQPQTHEKYRYLCIHHTLTNRPRKPPIYSLFD